MTPFHLTNRSNEVCLEPVVQGLSQARDEAVEETSVCNVCSSVLALRIARWKQAVSDTSLVSIRQTRVA